MNNNGFYLTVVGISHRTSTISEREKYQINRKEIPEALKYFQNKKEVESLIIVATCNRVEFYLVISNGADPFSIVHDFYSDRKNIHIDIKLFYRYSKSDVPKHLFRVVTGLDSMVLGEYQIQGQVKECYSIACSQKSADKILHKLFHGAFRTGKNVRSETRIGSGKQSLSGVAFQVIEKNLNKDELITIVGVNDNTRIIAEKLFKSGYDNLNFINRTGYKAEELADKYLGSTTDFKDLLKVLPKTKCLFTCTGADADEFIITAEELSECYSKKKLPSLIVDMAIPRDVEFKNTIDGIEYIDLEVLRNYLVEQQAEILSDLPKAEKIISDAANVFEVWTESQNDGNLSYVAEKAEMIRLQLLDETRQRLTESEYQLLDKFSRSLIHRVNSTFNQAVVIKELRESKTD
jgi:glutamyl-tRNA reductase